jgi:hypothetical protein
MQVEFISISSTSQDYSQISRRLPTFKVSTYSETPIHCGRQRTLRVMIRGVTRAWASRSGVLYTSFGQGTSEVLEILRTSRNLTFGDHIPALVKNSLQKANILFKVPSSWLFGTNHNSASALITIIGILQWKSSSREFSST